MPALIKDGSTVRQKMHAPFEGVVTRKGLAGDDIVYFVTDKDGNEQSFHEGDLEIVEEPAPAPADIRIAAEQAASAISIDAPAA